MDWKGLFSKASAGASSFAKKKAMATFFGALAMLVIGIIVGVAVVAGGMYLYHHWHPSLPTLSGGAISAPSPLLRNTVLALCAALLLTAIIIAVTRYIRSQRTARGRVRAPAIVVTPTPATAPASPTPTPATPGWWVRSTNTVKKVPLGKFFRVVGWVAAVILIILGLHYVPVLVSWLDKRLNLEAGGDPGTVITDAWSAPIEVPLGTSPIWAVRDNAAFQVKIWWKGSQMTVDFPRQAPGFHKGCGPTNWINENFSSFQVRLADKDVKQTKFDVSFVPYKKGGPCASAETAPPAPLPSHPVVLSLTPIDPAHLPRTMIEKK